jgi:hypothetical protein
MEMGHHLACQWDPFLNAVVPEVGKVIFRGNGPSAGMSVGFNAVVPEVAMSISHGDGPSAGMSVGSLPQCNGCRSSQGHSSWKWSISRIPASLPLETILMACFFIENNPKMGFNTHYPIWKIIG